MEVVLMENSLSHYNQWWAAAVWFIFYGVIILFTPFYRKRTVKPVKVYIAFAAAFVFEMFGIPVSMYAAGWLFGMAVPFPDGIFHGHTLSGIIGMTGMYIGILMMIAGLFLVITGWGLIHDRYWRKETGEGELVTTGIYKYIRHPQYTGLLLITLGMIAEWATIPLILMWPYLFHLYIKLAQKEEEEMVSIFGEKYIKYRIHTGMFLPRIKSVMLKNNRT